MTEFLRKNRLLAPFHQLKWQLALTYILVAFAAILLVSWWGFIAISVYLSSTNPEMTMVEATQSLVIPALRYLLPSMVLIAIPAILISTYFGFLTARWLDQRLTELWKTTQAWGQGDLSVRVVDNSNDEIGKFGEQLNQMADRLQTLMQTRQELSILEERYRLARDLHDSVKQHLCATSLQLAAAQSQFDQNLEASRESIKEAEQLAQVAQQDLGSIIFELRPIELNQMNLIEALDKTVHDWGRQRGVEVKFIVSGGRHLDVELEGAIFRFVQEALSNIARHSQASSAQIRLDFKDIELLISIEDNGRGFDPLETKEQGYGLRNMRERIQGIGGEITIDSLSNQGTRIIARVPVPT
ncbi:MAG: sensor histidine kinase [Anaerolineales bacterium]|nr:sensor histidine kinase [Anaerolineales bacterium]